MEKRGQGQIITTILIILLVIVIVVVVWNVVIKTVEEGSDQVDVNPLLVDGEVEYWVSDSDDVDASGNLIGEGEQIIVAVTKKAGGGDITGVKLLLEDASGSVYTYDNYNIFPKDLETKAYYMAREDVVPSVTGVEGFKTIAKVELYFAIGSEENPEYTPLIASAEDVTGVSSGVVPADSSVTTPRGGSGVGGGSDSTKTPPDSGEVCVVGDDGLFDNCPNPSIVITGCYELGEANKKYVLDEDFTIGNVGYCIPITASGVTLDCQGNTISMQDSNIMSGVINAISQDDITIKNCIITGTPSTAPGEIISLSGSNNKLISNTINGILNVNGISINGDNNILELNTLTNNKRGILVEGSDNKILNNEITDNSEEGLYLFGTNNIELSDNTICSNGIYDIGCSVGGDLDGMSGEGNAFDDFDMMSCAMEWPTAFQPCA
jgi:parallel beta-helix repeat protein